MPVRRTMPGDPPSGRQAEVLLFLRETLADTGRPPTLQEITDHFGFGSRTAAVCHLEALARKGFVRRPGTHQARGWVPVVEPGCCPCCGRPLGGPT